MKTRRLAAGLAVAAAAIAWVGSAGATAIFTGSGSSENSNAVSGEADFTLSGTTLTLLLSNTSGDTSDQGDALTGIVFSINGAQTLTFDMVAPCGQTLGPGSHTWASGTTMNDAVNLCGSWTNALAGSPPVPAEFGVATTGFNGEFNGGSITVGNASPNHGIVGASTFPGTIGGSQFPFVQNQLQFQFDVTSGSFAESDITGVQFLFGTNGTAHIPGECIRGCVTLQAPEPGTLALLGLGAFALVLRRRKA
jgi:hypothetical protein